MSTILVVTGSYNTDPRWLRACIESVDAQDAPHEHIVLDDGSDKPETLAVLAEYAPRVISEPHVGWGHGSAECRYNRHINAHPSDYIAVLDHDDVALPGRLRIERDYLDAHPEVAIVGSVATVIDAEGEVIAHWTYGGPYEAQTPPRFKHGYAKYRPLCHSSVMYRRSWFDRVGGYKGFPGDCLLFDSMADGGALFTILPEPLVLKRVWDGSVWCKQSPKKQKLLKKIGKAA
jgi:GT2 family glycosyltransferase